MPVCNDPFQCRVPATDAARGLFTAFGSSGCGTSVATVNSSSPKYLAATALTSSLVMLRNLAISRASASSGKPLTQLEPSSLA